MFIRMVVKHSCEKEPELILCFKTKGHIICMVFVFTQIFGKSHFKMLFFHTRAYSRRSVMCTEITFYSNWPFSSVLAFVYSLICKYDLRSSSALRWYLAYVYKTAFDFFIHFLLQLNKWFNHDIIFVVYVKKKYIVMKAWCKSILQQTSFTQSIGVNPDNLKMLNESFNTRRGWEPK